MSWTPTLDPDCPDDVGIDAIETLIVPRGRLARTVLREKAWRRGDH